MFERIGQYRSILARPPSSLTFDQLAEELLEHPPSEEAVEYLGAQLDRWPSHEPRMAPWQWLEMVKQGQNCPEMQLCTMIEAQNASFTDVYEAIYMMESPHMGRVRWLNLSENDLRMTEAIALGDSEAWPALEHLWLSGCSLDDEKLERILANRVMHLRELDLSSNHLGVMAGQHVATSPACAGLERLFWRQSTCTRESLFALCVSPGLMHLEHLELRASELHEACPVDVLSQAKSLPRLTHLGLSRNDLSKRQLQGLALLTGHMPSLRSLDLSEHVELDTDILVILLQHLPDTIERLFLSYSSIDDAGAQALTRAPQLEHLKMLDVKKTRLSSQGMSMLHERFSPGCQVFDSQATQVV